jgi:hypothetical protein
LGRPDIVCATSGNDVMPPLCVPMCALDSDCPGRRCDELTGLCIDRVPEHAPLYSSCVAGKPSGCAFSCLSRDPVPAGQTAAGYCTRPCTIDSATACGRSLGSPLSSGQVGFCLGSPQNGAGDVGFCMQLCDTVADCVDKDPGTTCEPFMTAAGGHPLCTPAVRSVADAGGVDAAPEATDAATTE